MKPNTITFVVVQLVDGSYTITINGTSIVLHCKNNVDLAEALHEEGLHFAEVCDNIEFDRKHPNFA